MARVASLDFGMSVDAKKLGRGLADARRKFRTFSRNVKRELGGLAKFGATAGAALAGGFIAAARKTLTEADKIAKRARSLQIGAKDLQTLSHAAAEAGIEFEKFSKIYQRVQQVQTEAHLGLTTYTDALDILGISSKQFGDSATTTKQALTLLSDAFRNAGGNAVKLGALNKLLGARITGLTGTMLANIRAFFATQAQYERMGGYIEERLLPGAEEFNDTMTKLGTVAFAQFSNAVLEALPRFESVEAFVTDMGMKVRGLTTDFIDFAKELKNVGEELQRFVRDNAGMLSLLAVGIGAFKGFKLGKGVGPKGAGIGAGVGAVGTAAGLGALFWDEIKASFLDEDSYRRMRGGMGDAGDATDALWQSLMHLNETALESAKAVDGFDAALAGIREIPEGIQLATQEAMLGFARHARNALPFGRKPGEDFLQAFGLVPRGPAPEPAAPQPHRLARWWEGMSDKLKKDFASFGGMVRENLRTALLTGDLKPVGKAFLQSLQAALIDSLLEGLGRGLKAVLEGGGFSAFLGGFGFGGGRAAGGPVRGGVPYLVGERGMEMFVPQASGRIIPHGRLGGGGTSVVNNFQIVGDVTRQTRDVLRRDAALIGDLVSATRREQGVVS